MPHTNDVFLMNPLLSNIYSDKTAINTLAPSSCETVHTPPNKKIVHLYVPLHQYGVCFIRHYYSRHCNTTQICSLCTQYSSFIVNMISYDIPNFVCWREKWEIQITSNFYAIRLPCYQ